MPLPDTARLMRTTWRAWLAEATAIGAFMIAALVCTVAIEHPASPLRQLVADATARRALMGLAMGSTAIALIYSPLAAVSGAHMNPAVTLAFVRLGRLGWADAAAYVAAQCAGATVATWAAARVLGRWASDPAVNFVATQPGAAGAAAAGAAEATIAFLMCALVLAVSSRPATMRLTGLAAGTFVMAAIVVEAPLSGMSMNPARSLGPAIVSGQFPAFWIYVLAPIAGMQLAAGLHAAGARRGCPTLHHPPRARCVFCAA
jgi:aquaporin Z